MLQQALIINGIVLFAVLEADLGPKRKIGWFRIARPLLTAGAIVPLYLDAPATHGTGLALELAGAGAGVLVGLTAMALIRVRRDDATGKPVSRAGVAYAALWISVIGARSCFSIGAEHWFRTPLTHWMAQHQVTGDAITDTLIIMAVAMSITRTLGLAVRARDARAGTPRATARRVAAGRA